MKIDLPLLLDFYPLQDEKYTKIHKFFENLKERKFTTTKCLKCESLMWHPRLICPNCNSDDVDWVNIPKVGKILSFSSVNAGAPMGFEDKVPFSVALIELENGMKILSIVDAKYEDLAVGKKVELNVYQLEDSRVWFNFKPI